MPALDTKTKVLAPDFLACSASSTLRSWSIFHWLVMPPAAARVVPTEEMTVLGAGVREASLLAQRAVSGSIVAWRFGPVDLGARREMVWMVVDEPGARRVERMCEPTRPVQPKMAVEDMTAIEVVLMMGVVCCFVCWFTMDYEWR